jgi:hypothetical protein
MISSLRQKMQKSPAVGGGVVGGILLVAIVIFVFSGGDDVGGPPVITHMWFQDLNTGETFVVEVGDTRELPPHATESGPLKENAGPLKSGDPAGVLAHKYACGDCSGEQFVGYLESGSVARRKLLISGDAMASLTEEGMKVKSEIGYRRADGGEWANPDSPEALKIFDELKSKCKGSKLVECYPH